MGNSIQYEDRNPLSICCLGREKTPRDEASIVSTRNNVSLYKPANFSITSDVKHIYERDENALKSQVDIKLYKISE